MSLSGAMESSAMSYVCVWVDAAGGVHCTGRGAGADAGTGVQSCKLTQWQTQSQ